MSVKKNINLFTPKYHVEECLSQIRECLEIGWTGIGYKTIEFEEAWKKYTKLDNAHFLNSATAGLHLALEILKEENGWSNQDEIITTPITFVSTNHSILYCNLKPVFADIDEYGCLCPKSVLSKINNKTKAVMFVGLGGSTGKYQEIAKICKERKLSLILDAAHMAGTYLNNATPGNDSDVIVYSFQAVKNLPTFDSGMICFKEKRFDEIARKKSWLGINKDTFSRTNNLGSYKWKYDVEYVGYKYNGNSVAAGIGMVQLKYLDEENARRREICKLYDKFLSSCESIQFVKTPENCLSSRHLYQILVENRDEVIENLNAEGIFPGVHYISNANYRMFYSENNKELIESEKFSNKSISLPLNLRMDEEDVKLVSEKLLKIISKN